MAQQTYGEWMRSNPPIPNLTALDWYYEQTVIQGKTNYAGLLEQAKQMEKEQIKDAMMYALDEDGHTGEWKRKFVDNYYMSSFLHNKLDKDDA